MTSSLPVRYVTLAYGDDDRVYDQASMLLLSLIAYAPEPRELVVATDRPERFTWFERDVRVHPITAGELADWRGKDPFSMRQKLELARVVMPAKGALVLLDADTLVQRDLTAMVDALAEGALFLHKREFQLGYSRRRGNMALWKEISKRTYAGWYFRPGDAMWNSGVIALPVAQAPLLAQAIQLYDAVAEAGIRHFATEQLVLGQVLGRTQRLREALPWLTHYWGNKKAFDAENGRRLAEFRGAGLCPSEAAEVLRSNPIDLPAEVRPGRFQKIKRWITSGKALVGQTQSLIAYR